jgi:hypothetical protein
MLRPQIDTNTCIIDILQFLDYILLLLLSTENYKTRVVVKILFIRSWWNRLEGSTAEMELHRDVKNTHRQQDGSISLFPFLQKESNQEGGEGKMKERNKISQS